MTSVQLQEWKTFEKQHMFSDERLEYLFASLVQTMLNIIRGRKGKPVDLENVHLRFGDDIPVKITDWRTMRDATQKFAVDQRDDQPRRKRRG